MIDLKRARELCDRALSSGLSSGADRTESYELMEAALTEVEQMQRGLEGVTADELAREMYDEFRREAALQDVTLHMGDSRGRESSPRWIDLDVRAQSAWIAAARKAIAHVRRRVGVGP